MLEIVAWGTTTMRKPSRPPSNNSAKSSGRVSLFSVALRYASVRVHAAKRAHRPRLTGGSAVLQTAASLFLAFQRFWHTCPMPPWNFLAWPRASASPPLSRSSVAKPSSAQSSLPHHRTPPSGTCNVSRPPPQRSRAEENRQIRAVHGDLAQLNSDLIALEKSAISRQAASP